jgi:hypothetical protein
MTSGFSAFNEPSKPNGRGRCCGPKKRRKATPETEPFPGAQRHAAHIYVQIVVRTSGFDPYAKILSQLGKFPNRLTAQGGSKPPRGIRE